MPVPVKQKETRVLIVEEDSTFLKMWEKVFRLIEGCHYSLTNDPEMAATVAKDHPVDLLVSEVVINKGNGFELAEKIHKSNPKAEIILTTSYNCDLRRFNLSNPRFHILYKPYRSIEDVIKMVTDVLNHRDPRTEADEDSWSENETYPKVMEWKL